MPHREGEAILPSGVSTRQLDVDKLCGAVSPDETCWLCDRSGVAWNRVMHRLACEIIETSAGLLRYSSTAERAESTPTSAIRYASSPRFLASWLLCHNPCIQERTCCTTTRYTSFSGFGALVQPHLHSGTERGVRATHTDIPWDQLSLPCRTGYTRVKLARRKLRAEHLIKGKILF
ncbi:hypothetical protein HPB50_001914 [Hyalomma asiaticum]|uniref:Uncharacterized protein n=1 Tax=Hyalomma asiaticum TaxID=266040 RepID=A0ACB7TAK5_HYAAI|nr:hypothetical protein HPB50_001914 [Hyalomma asiaticum]